jgi:biotin carboxyl carrier protein
VTDAATPTPDPLAAAERLARLAAECGLSELRLRTADGLRIAVRRGLEPERTGIGEVPAAAAIPATSPAAPSRVEVRVPAGAAGTVHLFDPDGEPLVAVGQRVTPEKVIATVEHAGDNGAAVVDDILAGCTGVVRKIGVCDRERVGPGMLLLEVGAPEPAPLPPGGPAAADAAGHGEWKKRPAADGD